MRFSLKIQGINPFIFIKGLEISLFLNSIETENESLLEKTPLK